MKRRLLALKSAGAPDVGPDVGEDAGIMAEINITPLTDIFLVLLIIFMVTSSVMSQMGINVNLPQTSPATSQAQPEGVIVTLLSDGKMSVNDRPIPARDWKSFQQSLSAAFAKTASKLVILEGDRKAFLGSAIQVMDYSKRAGAERFAIATSLSSDASPDAN